MGEEIAAKVRAAARKLCRELIDLRFGAPVTHVYNPLEYARRSHNTYVRLYGADLKRVIFLGMNPGPFGMAQTGVPFGDVEQVRGWLGIEEVVGRPPSEHPKRPIQGFACTRREVSGTRLWGALAAHYGRPGRFFAGCFVANYCPLVFIEATGRNRTPDKLPVHERAPLFAACDAHLSRLVEILQPQWVVGIGAFAEKRAHEALGDCGVRIGRILHPSPANPRANRGWSKCVRSELEALGICSGRTKSTAGASERTRAVKPQ